MRGQTQLVTFAPDGTAPRWLNQIGAYDGLKYSFKTSGGCAALTANFRRPPRWRGDALNAGRMLWACRGGSWCWKGIVDEPEVSEDTGWALSAHGAGGIGDDYLAIWTGSWGTGVFDNAVNAAIGRGLPWVNPGVGSPAGIWTGQQVDSGTQTITNLLDLGCHKGGLAWSVATQPGGNWLSVYPLPTVANRVLVAVNPEARSVGDGPSDLYVRYQATWDNGSTLATYGLTSVANTIDRAAHGRREQLMDISSAGVYTAGQAQGIASSTLAQWVRAGFADPFTVNHGELLTQGGVPADLGSFWSDGITAMVCEPWLADYSYGGEQLPGLTSFMVGEYEYDEDNDQAVITPMEADRHDFASLLQGAVDATPVRVQPVTKTKKKKKK